MSREYVFDSHIHDTVESPSGKGVVFTRQTFGGFESLFDHHAGQGLVVPEQGGKSHD